MDKLAQALDALEAHGLAVPAGTETNTSEDTTSTYISLRGDLVRLVAALSAMGGDHARVGQVIEHMTHGADKLMRNMVSTTSPQNSL